MAPLTMFGGLARSFGGLWQYLIARSHDRAQLEVEREWIRAGREVLTLIPPGAFFFEYGGAGRYRAILMPGQQPAIPTEPITGLPEPSGP